MIEVTDLMVERALDEFSRRYDEATNRGIFNIALERSARSRSMRAALETALEVAEKAKPVDEVGARLDRLERAVRLLSGEWAWGGGDESLSGLVDDILERR